jgi:hypothetical protein
MAEREQYQGQPAAGFKPLEEWGEVEALSDEELEAWKRSPVERLESRVIATVARLQERVEEAEREHNILLKDLERKDGELRLAKEDFSPEAWEEQLQRSEELERQLDEARALAERRKEALEKIAALPVNQALVRRIEVEARDIARAAIEEEGT